MSHKAIEWIKGLFTTPSAGSLAVKEIEDAKRRLLEAQSSREYAESMCDYYEAKIKRLTIYIRATAPAKQ